MTGRAHVERVFAEAASRPGFSGRVILTTIFGDALLPRQQPAPVKALSHLVAPLGINDRLVRTSLLRLARDQTVASQRVGRQSFYTVHPSALATFRQANIRIYQQQAENWDGEWTTVIADSKHSEPADLNRFERELRWLGFSHPSPGVAMSATVSVADVAATAERTNVMLFALQRGKLAAGTISSETNRWSLADPTGAHQRSFAEHNETFGPCREGASALEPEAAFALRTLLITSWRRIALRTLDLPRQLLPSQWPADGARSLTRELHQLLRPASEAHLDEVVDTTSKAAPDPWI